MNLRKYLVLAGVSVFAPVGDALLSYGMKQVGNISLQHFSDLLLAIANPWVGLGVIFLLGFFASYMTALSWADLTYVLPASSLGYVLLALIARFALHEHVTTMRWLGIALVSSGAGRRLFLRHAGASATSAPVLMNPFSSRSISCGNHSVHGRAPIIEKTAGVLIVLRSPVRVFSNSTCSSLWSPNIFRISVR